MALGSFYLLGGGGEDTGGSDICYGQERMMSSLGGEEGQVFQEKEGHKDREEWIPIGC